MLKASCNPTTPLGHMQSTQSFSEITSRNKLKVAREVGFEPTTLGLEDRCSIQLSYSRNSNYLVVIRSAFRNDKP